MPRSSSAPLRLTVGLVGALAILGGSVQAGLAVPDEERVQDAASVADLDYTAIGTRIRPLSEEFIARVLGRELPPDPTTPSIASTIGATASAPPPPAEPDPAAQPPPPPSEDRAEAVEHPPTNDRFDEAVAVSGVPYSASTDGTRAGRQSGEPADCAPVGGTLWYRYDAADTEALVASTAGTQGTVVLGVFAGRTLQDLTLVGCDTGVTGEAAVPFTATAGQTYHFQVSAAAGGSRVVFNLDALGATREVAPPQSPGRVDTAVSEDGRWVAFTTVQADLVEGDPDTNGVKDVFVRDMVTGEVERVSVASDGTEGDDKVGLGLDISDDGRFVAFWSHATNLVEGDTNNWPDVFVHDRHTGRTERISVTSDGEQGTPRLSPDETIQNDLQVSVAETDRSVSMSADGQRVVFGTRLELSAADQLRELGPEDGSYNGILGTDQTDVYLRDRRTGETRMVGVGDDGQQPDLHTWFPAISGDGNVVSFRSADDALTADDGNEQLDIFVRDLAAGTTQLVSRSTTGETGNDISYKSALSFDGRFVAFASAASNLVTEDTNGLPDVFVHDRQTRVTERVSVSTAGTQQQIGGDARDRAYDGQPGTAISHDGRFVAFDSPAPNLAPGDDRRDPPHYSARDSDVFLHDRDRNTTIMVSVGSNGRQGNEPSRVPSISGDGQHVAFSSAATDLADPDADEAGLLLIPTGAYMHTVGTRTPDN